MHAVTGCDATSFFYGIGKKKAFQVVLASEEFQNALSLVGEITALGEETKYVLESFVCELYGSSKMEDINELQYRTFSSKCDPRSLPPTKDEVSQYFLRDNYAALVMKSGLDWHPNITNPTFHGWKIINDSLVVNWMTKPPIPEMLAEALNCKCQKGKCETKRCRCLSANLKCNVLCQCNDCNNCDEEDVTDSDESSTEDCYLSEESDGE